MVTNYPVLYTYMNMIVSDCQIQDQLYYLQLKYLCYMITLKFVVFITFFNFGKKRKWLETGLSGLIILLVI